MRICLYPPKYMASSGPKTPRYKLASQMPIEVTAQVGVAGIMKVLAKVFHNEDALRSYLQNHPKADPSKHSVKPSSKGKSEKQREVIERALEMGKPKKDQKPTPKDHSEQFKVLKGLSPREQRKVIERALKMASLAMATD